MCDNNLILLREKGNTYNCDIYIVIKMEKNTKNGVPIIIGLYKNISDANKCIKNNNYSLQGPFNVKCKTESIPMLDEKGIITDFHKIISNIYTN